MKKIFTLTLTLLIAWLAGPVHAQKDFKEAVAQPGTIFVYQVDYEGSVYLFIIKLKHLSADSVTMQWMMTHNMSGGTLTMTREALEKATAMMNYYSDGNYTLTDQTSGWVSQAAYRSLKEGKTVTFDMGEEEPLKFVAYFGDQDNKSFENALTEFPVVTDQRFGGVNAFPAIKLLNFNKMYSMMVSGWEDFPIVLSMNLGWSIRLVAIL
ncbi:MAG: hypothetical protein JW861_02190 [Bacteroidales bacterium]|nr:hypothetical protein [Bacteroidales bacterium]